ncbi:MAG TPA: flagellar motor switch protein FliM, partial [Candidatus Nitrosotalea sp.]|nr:flagellar motor switch protein FliM [Candidatus Nitrosotalea sp.]
SPPKKTFETYDLRQSRQLDADHVQILTTLHEGLARRLGNSLGAYLRVGFEMNLVSIEQLTYREFMTRIPEMTYFASMHILPIDARAAFQADLSLVFPIVDVVLGGSGADQIDPRDLTEIEEQIFETVVGLIVRDLQITWAPVLQLDIQYEQRQQHSQVQGLMLPMEKVLSLTFEIRLSNAHGNITFAFPAVVANALMRKISVQWSFAGPLPSRETRRQLRSRLLDARFEASLSLSPSGVTVRELIALEPGSLLVLPKHANEPVDLNIAGKPMFLAFPVRHGRQRGARVDQRLSLTASAGREGR